MSVDVVLKAKPKAEVAEPISPELTINALKANAARQRMRVEQLVTLLRRNVCPTEAATHEDLCLWCGKRECAQAREFLERNF